MYHPCNIWAIKPHASGNYNAQVGVRTGKGHENVILHYVAVQLKNISTNRNCPMLIESVIHDATDTS